MKKWKILADYKQNVSSITVDKVIDILFENRDIKTKKEQEYFLNPRLESITLDSLNIEKNNIKKAVTRIKRAIERKERIIIFGDYDVDGICGAAILWESLAKLGAEVMPYIPHRIEEGYGLSIKGIDNITSEEVKLIITVDNGIVAHEAVEYANKKGIDVIITDHHVASDKLPKAYAIVHTTKLCGAGVGFILTKVIEQSFNFVIQASDPHLELVCLATIADLVPLQGANRILTIHGLISLRNTKRVGLLELYSEASLDQKKIGVYEIGHIIAPRLNAMGRLENAMDSLRLLCTPNKNRAYELATKLGSTNKIRQGITEETVLHAKQFVTKKETLSKIIFLYHESYTPGVIGLVAGRIMEQFYRPTIVISKGETYSKASARSISGFNIIQFIRQANELLVDAGGHPMAAGFTIATENIILLQKKLEEIAETLLHEDLLIRNLRIDVKIPFSFIDTFFYNKLQEFAPFGMGNPEPTFVTEEVIVNDCRIIGRDGRHAKLKLSQGKKVFDAIAFNMAEQCKNFSIGNKVAIVYTIDVNEWNGNRNLQLIIKDMKV